MAIVAFDVETAYSTDYSLSRMSTMDYVLDPRFEIIGGAVRQDDGPSEFFVGINALRRRLHKIDWSRNAMLSHNTAFDAAIAAWHMDVHPAFYLDTLSMSRATIAQSATGASLAKVAAYLGLPPKGEAVHRMRGKWLRDFTPGELEEYSAYCCLDNDICYDVFHLLRERYPLSELSVIDLVIRAFVQPQARLNPTVLSRHLAAVQARKAQTMAKVGHILSAVFASNQQFAALLTNMGVEVPMKPSPADPTKMIPALARGDRAFKELSDDASQTEEVQAVLAARVSVKSTLEETRTTKMLGAAMREWPDGLGHGWLAVPMKYYAARTGRMGGADGTNYQNIPRGSDMREAIEAVPGHAIVVRDASQIEARMNAWLSGCTALTAAFAAGVDVYAQFASRVYGRRVNKNDHPLERFVGKTGILGLGYGCGHERFQHMLFIGNGGVSVRMDADESRHVVQSYRREYHHIPALWRHCDTILLRMCSLRTPMPARIQRLFHMPMHIGPIEAGVDALWLPNGMPITYRNLRIERSYTENRIVYDDTFGTLVGIYGAKVVENACQALARIVLSDIATRVWRRRRRFPFMQVHDSLVYSVPVAEAQEFDQYLEAEFACRPAWATGLPLASDGGWGRTLAAAERHENSLPE